MATTSSRKAFLIHLIVYLGVIAALFYVNATETLDEGETRKWWAIWPLVGWGIGVLAHGLAEWTERHSREGSLMADPDVRGVAIHLFVYLSVNAFLIAINILETPDSIWALWPVLGWGLGLAIHAWLAYRAVLKKTVQRYATEQEILTQMQLERQAEDIAAAIETRETVKKPARRTRRKQAAKKTTRSAASRKGAAAKTAAKKKPAAKRKAPAKPATRKKPASRSRAKT